MADTDQSLYNLRYNQVEQGLEGFGGGTPQWTPLILNADGGVTGVKISAGSTNTGLITLAAGTNVTITNSPAGTFTISSSGGGSQVLPQVLSNNNTNGINTGTDTPVSLQLGTAITLQKSTNSVLISSTINVQAIGSHGINVVLSIYRDGVDLSGDPWMVLLNPTVSSDGAIPVTLTWLDAPGDTASHTYDVYVQATSFAVTCNGAVPGVIVVQEILS